MVSPFAADDDHDAAFASTEDAVTPSDDDETVGPRSEVVHDDVDVDEGVIPEDDVKVIAPARPVPTHLRALPPVEPPTAASQIPRLRDMIRQEGRTPEEAARELGIDPIVASMWLRLPENLWGTGPLAPSTPPTPITTPPIGGIMRVLSCRIPAPAFERLRVGEGSVIERAQEALDAGFQALDSGMTLPLSSARWKGFTRPLALTVDGDTYVRLRDIAGQSFDDDMRDAAGWLIARGVGVSVTNVAPVRPVTAVSATAPTTATKPTPIRPAVPASSSASTVLPVTAPASVTTSDSEDGSPPPAPGPIRKERVIEAIRARATPRAALPPDDSAPDGDELRRRREAVGISQRDLAAASGLSRGLVAEVERGRRRHVMTRARIAETLASVAAEKGISLDTGTSVAV
ncbi:MAG: helix-turn-helix domain-containing protein [Chloroflexi bacterium]|jgi:DNA-binding XRE family transcriptional regulator|nr:helix-turn-helix domain-containing protein [Chloroflexota bacterium]